MITFYVSGHGYGHATRAAAVISALRDVVYNRTPVECRVVESSDAMQVDTAATAAEAAGFLKSARPSQARSHACIASGSGDRKFRLGLDL
jgi:hypothetical protein